MGKQIARRDARRILRLVGAHQTDFHTLHTAQIGLLLVYARECNYRRPKHANGSKARYFHAYLERRARHVRVVSEEIRDKWIKRDPSLADIFITQYEMEEM